MASQAILASIPDKPDPGWPGYFQFPNELGRKCGQIGSAAIMVYVALAIHTRQDGKCWPSIGTLAGITRLSERTVRRAIRKLGQTGWLKEEFRPGTSTLYHLRRADTTDTTPLQWGGHHSSTKQMKLNANAMPTRLAR